MNNYRYTLEQYKGRGSRYKCPQCGEQHCFVRYIDTHTGEHLSADTGRCNREVKCGYHRTPAEFLSQNSKAKSQNFYPTGKSQIINPKSHRVNSNRQIPNPIGKSQIINSKSHKVNSNRQIPNPNEKSQIINPKSQPRVTTPLLGGAGGGYHTIAQLHATLTDYGTNHLVQFLTQRLGVNAVQRLLEQYRIGTHHHWRGSTVFWYVDAQQQVCSGKVMQYNPADGRRVKQPFNHITWMHSLLKMEGFSRRACLFGEHLLRNTVLPVSIVESEKTALIAAHYLPQSIWLATGGLSALNVAHCKQVLKGRKVTLFPDEGAYDKWYQLSVHLPNCNISRLADNYGFRPGNDLGDLLLRA